MENYFVKLKINKTLTEKEKLKEIYKYIKQFTLQTENSNNPKQIEKLIKEIKSIDLNIAVPEEYFYEATEINCIDKLHELYKNRYENINKEDSKRRQCFDNFYKMLD